MKTKLSIVIPLFNEEENIKALFSELNRLSSKLPKSTEVILVDDGSSDKTLSLLQKTKLKYYKKLISFTRNFGHQSALLAGLEKSSGDLVICMDGDLQHPPELIPKMIKLFNEGYDVVLTQKESYEKESYLKTGLSRLFYRLVNSLSSVDITNSASDFRLMSRRSLNALLNMKETRKFLRGQVAWIGFDYVILPFAVKARHAGKSKYSLKKMLLLAVEGITSFSTLPLHLAGIAGLILIIMSVAYGIYIVTKFMVGATVEGWASILLVLLVVGSATFLFLGIIGIYLAAVYEELKKRPNYLIKEIIDD